MIRSAAWAAFDAVRQRLRLVSLSDLVMRELEQRKVFNGELARVLELTQVTSRHLAGVRKDVEALAALKQDVQIYTRTLSELSNDVGRFKDFMKQGVQS